MQLMPCGDRQEIDHLRNTSLSTATIGCVLCATRGKLASNFGLLMKILLCDTDDLRLKLDQRLVPCQRPANSPALHSMWLVSTGHIFSGIYLEIIFPISP